MIEVDNGRATTFHIMFKNGKTSGYTFAGISGINANVSYGINGNFVHQTDASHYEVLEGGIYITEITHTALTGNWCRGLPLTGRKVTQ